MGRASAYAGAPLGRLGARPSVPLRDFEEVFDQRVGKLGIVDVERQSNKPTVRRLAQAVLQRIEQRSVGLGIKEWRAGNVQRRDALLGNEETQRTFASI